MALRGRTEESRINTIAVVESTKMNPGHCPYPMFLTLAFGGKDKQLAKALVSSCNRSLCSGEQVIFKNSEPPIFKIERKPVKEVMVALAILKNEEAVAREARRAFLFSITQHVSPRNRQWVILADAAGLALRNIDHLIPADSKDAHAPAEVDFYWTKSMDRNDVRGEVSASPGVWAVRGEYLPMVLERWQSAWSELEEGAQVDEASVWSRVVKNLPLRKKPFEKGEVYAPEIDMVDWDALSHAAFVTVVDWPEKEQRKFLQALYFGTYFGDENGLILNLLDP